MPMGAIPPTSRRIRWGSVEIVRVRAGRITSWRSYFDQLEALHSLGLELRL